MAIACKPINDGNVITDCRYMVTTSDDESRGNQSSRDNQSSLRGHGFPPLFIP